MLEMIFLNCWDYWVCAGVSIYGWERLKRFLHAALLPKKTKKPLRMKQAKKPRVVQLSDDSFEMTKSGLDETTLDKLIEFKPEQLKEVLLKGQHWRKAIQK